MYCLFHITTNWASLIFTVTSLLKGDIWKWLKTDREQDTKRRLKTRIPPSVTGLGICASTRKCKGQGGSQLKTKPICFAVSSCARLHFMLFPYKGEVKTLFRAKEKQLLCLQSSDVMREMPNKKVSIIVCIILHCVLKQNSTPRSQSKCNC